MAIPTTVQVPLFYAEVDYSGASAPTTSGPTLLMGTLLSGGTGSANSPVQVFSAAEVAGLFGRGSQIHREAIAYFAGDRAAGEVWALALAEATTAAEGKITIAGTATETRTLHLEIGGVVLDIDVTSGDLHTAVAAAVALALKTHAVEPNDYQVSAVAAAGVLTLTAKYKGETGNGISVLVNPLGSGARQSTPLGLTVTIEKMGVTTEGSGDPVLTTAIAAVAGMPFDFIFAPWTGIASLASYKTMMSDVGGRWDYENQDFGHVWSSRFGGAAELLAVDPNDVHLLFVGAEGVNNASHYDQTMPNLPEEVGAAYMARCASSLRIDPALPCQTLALIDDAAGLIRFRAPNKTDRMTVTERNSILGGGVATVSYTNQGGILVERAKTSYTEDVYGNGVDLDVQALYTSSYVLRRWKAKIETDFGRSKILANTPEEIKGALVAEYAEMEALGIVTDTDGFAATLSVTVDGTIAQRINVATTPDYAKQLRVVALANNFIP